MKKHFLGFWGEEIKNLKLEDQGDIILASGTGECPKAFLETKNEMPQQIDVTQIISVPVCFEISKKTNKKNGSYRIYAPEEVIEGFKVPQEYEQRYSPLLFECIYQEDKLKGHPRFYDANGKSYPIVLENTFTKANLIKKINQNARA